MFFVLQIRERNLYLDVACHIFIQLYSKTLTNGSSPNFDNCYHLIESVIPGPHADILLSLVLFFITDLKYCLIV